MIPVEFEYIAPERLDDALRMASERGAMILAGGHRLLIDLERRRVRPRVLVDLRNIPTLRGVHREESGGLEIGAMTTCSDLAASEEVREDYPALAEAAAATGDPQVRNLATIGGALASNDPTADLAAAFLALGATIQSAGPGSGRRIAADDFLRGPFETLLERGEVVTAVHLPAPATRTGGAYEKFKCLADGSALCGIAASMTLDGGGNVAACRVVLDGAADRTRRLHKVEAALMGTRPTASGIAEAVAALRDEALAYTSDSRASADYRAHLAEVLAERALATSARRAGVPRGA